MGIMKLSEEEYRLISSLVYEKFGICLGNHKRALVAGRLHKVLSTGGFASFKDYYNYVVNEPSGQALLTLVDRISTNHTYFFREKDHFEFFKTIALPQIISTLKKKQSRDIRIWCAGCSSGEEPYTLAMILNEFFSQCMPTMDIGILATDISVSALEKAAVGEYTPDKMTQVPLTFRQKYFFPLANGNWKVNQLLKEKVVFRRLNLMGKTYPFKGLFQAIFCRNVMIYFDKATQQSLVERFHRYTEPGGYLLIGHSETLDRSSNLYKYIQPSVYQKYS